MTSERRKQIRKRRKRKKKNRFLLWFRRLGKGKQAALIVLFLLLILIIAFVLFVMSKFAKLDRQVIDKDDIIINQFDEPVGEGYTNFVLFGGDSRNGDVKRDLNTDVVMIVSLNNKTREVKLVSVYRDTLLDIGNGKIKKCNSAYPTGGATQAINMLNRNLDLDIQQYVTVSFGAVADVIDMLGGIEVEVSEKEWKEVNKYIGETGMVAGKPANLLTHSGLQTLDGVQATTYARIRKGVGDDYARTERQRRIIQIAAQKAMKADFGTLNKIIDKVFPQIATNLSMTDIIKYAKDITKYKIGETTGFPFERGGGVIPGRGDCVFPITLEKNVTLLHAFLYGTEDYQPTSEVADISDEIASIVGNRKAEPNTQWQDNSGGTTTKPSDTTTTPADTPSTEPGDDGPDTTKPGEGSGTQPGGGTENPGGTGGDSSGGSGGEGSSEEGSGGGTGGGGTGGSEGGGTQGGSGDAGEGGGTDAGSGLQGTEQ